MTTLLIYVIVAVNMSTFINPQKRYPARTRSGATRESQSPVKRSLRKEATASPNAARAGKSPKKTAKSPASEQTASSKSRSVDRGPAQTARGVQPGQ